MKQSSSIPGVAGFEFLIDQNAIEAAIAPQAALWLNTLMCEVLDEAIPATPYQTGNLARSTNYTIDGWGVNLIGRITAATFYALFVHEGTGPHVIVPRRAKVLRFNTARGVVFARKVYHPGTRAQPWLREAMVSVLGRRGMGG